MLQIQCRWTKELATVTKNSSPWDKKNGIRNPAAGISRGQGLSVGHGGNGEGSRNRTTWAEEAKPWILEKPDFNCHLNCIVRKVLILVLSTYQVSFIICWTKMIKGVENLGLFSVILVPYQF